MSHKFKITHAFCLHGLRSCGPLLHPLERCNEAFWIRCKLSFTSAFRYHVYQRIMARSSYHHPAGMLKEAIDLRAENCFSALCTSVFLYFCISVFPFASTLQRRIESVPESEPTRSLNPNRTITIWVPGAARASYTDSRELFSCF